MQNRCRKLIVLQSRENCFGRQKNRSIKFKLRIFKNGVVCNIHFGSRGQAAGRQRRLLAGQHQRKLLRDDVNGSYYGMTSTEVTYEGRR
jgi:hypothetical protein